MRERIAVALAAVGIVAMGLGASLGWAQTHPIATADTALVQTTP